MSFARLTVGFTFARKIYVVMTNVLIPTDFTESSQNAINYAMDYFADTPVNFYILHVAIHNSSFRQRQHEIIHQSSEDSDSSRAGSFLEEEVSNYKLLARNPEHQFYAITDNALLVEAVRKQVAENEIDLIVMGTKGLTSSDHDELNSNTYEVITKVKCPIMVIPEYARMHKIENIAFLTDYNCLYRNKVISVLSSALNLHKVPLRLLHLRQKDSRLTPVQVDNKGFLHYFFRDVKHSFHFLENQNLEVGIHDFIETWDISIVAIAARNLNFIQRLMLRPASQNTNGHDKVPFLILHE